MNELISIVIPIYKVEEYIHQCINSVINQTYENIEIILVDDGSPDRCPAICDDYAARDNRIKVIHKSNGGLTSAWIEGLENVSKEVKYVTFVDSDDWIPRTYIEEFVNKAIQHSAGLVVGNTEKFYKNEKESYSSGHVGLYDKEKLEKEIYPYLLYSGKFHERAIPVSRWGKLYRKEFLEKNISYCDSCTTYSEDLNITFPVILDVEKIFFLSPNEGKYQYRLNPKSMVHAYDKNMLNSIFHVYPSLIKICKDKGHREIIPQVHADFLAASVQYYKNELQNPKGFRVAKKNIEKDTRNKMLISAIANIDWRGYRKLNVIIIRVMKRFNWFNKNVVTGILRILKISGIRKPT